MEDKIEVVVEEKKGVKTFFKRHKVAVISTAAASTAVSIISLVLFKGKKSSNNLVVRKTSSPLAKKIDADIFTELAPTIEEAVMNVGLEKIVIERSYSLDCLTHKLVTVVVESIHGD